ncbi:MAG: substrate-binding domain-containing protein [Solirubrobacterales bacterium]
MFPSTRTPCAQLASTLRSAVRARARARRSQLFGIAAAVIALALIGSGCGSSSSSSGTTDSSTSAATSKGDPILVVGAPLSDPFWGAVKQGTDAAAKQLGVNYQYVPLKDESNIVASYGEAIEQAIARHPAALIVGGFFPSVEGLVKKATAEGIPVFMFDAGAKTWQQWGALGFVGEDSPAMGQVAGELSTQAGVTDGLCFNGTPGDPQQEERCNGYIEVVKAAGGTAKMIQIPAADATNPSAVTQDVSGALASDSSVNGVYLSTAALEAPAQQAVSSLGRSGKITIGTNDISTQALNDVKSGKALFIIDHQPYIEGYDAVQEAAQYLLYDMLPASAISSGPFAITKENVDKVISVNEEHPGIRGAQ